MDSKKGEKERNTQKNTKIEHFPNTTGLENERG